MTLVRNDENAFLSDVFVFDRERRRLRLVSRNSDGEQGNDDSFGALVSDDGEVVVFSSRASHLVRRNTNQVQTRAFHAPTVSLLNVAARGPSCPTELRSRRSLQMTPLRP